MQYDRDMRFARFRPAPGPWRSEGPFRGRFPQEFEYDDDFIDDDDDVEYDAQFRAGPEYDDEFEDGWNDAPRGYDRGYRGGRNRPAQEEEQFKFGDGYIGGRGYGGTNYDLNHGYRTTAATRGVNESGRIEAPKEKHEPSSVATRGGYEWGEEAALEETFGPARYGYGPYADRLQRPRRSDEEIQKEVEDTLFYDTWVDADRITVEVREGVVTLRGELPDYQEIRYATDDAWDVEGVRGLNSELRVASGGARDDRSANVREDARQASDAKSKAASKATDSKSAGSKAAGAKSAGSKAAPAKKSSRSKSR
jgi:hypothetical protein